MENQLAKGLMTLGLILLIIGALFYFFQGKSIGLGRLPGDFRIEKENFSMYIPITSMLLLSLLVTLILFIIRKLGI
ncbi:DUF2905 domain-containing protein [Pararhodonellum marinum]|uniref:DUF2905 domain-containing protein n=1 Tax=Pararhodonellum marinum TaxID=2755358 RepID=UPI00188F07CC|nr:DUF2905 domain-containing protein [Pararhodonellum marinum]